MKKAEKTTAQWVFHYGMLYRTVSFNYGIGNITGKQNEHYVQLIHNAFLNKFFPNTKPYHNEI